MTDEKISAVATLAVAVFNKTTLRPDQDPAREIMTIYKRLARRLEAVNESLAEEARLAQSERQAGR